MAAGLALMVVPAVITVQLSAPEPPPIAPPAAPAPETPPADVGRLPAVQIDCEAGVAALAFSPDARRLVAADVEGRLLLLDKTGDDRRPFRGPDQARARAVVFLDESRFAVLGADGGVGCWHTGARPAGDAGVFPARDGLAGISGSVRSGWFAWAAADGSAWMINGGSHEHHSPVRLTGAGLIDSAPVVSPDTHPLFAAAAVGDEVRVWNLSSGRLDRTVSLTGHTQKVRALVFGPGGRLFTAGDDGTIRTWFLPDGRPGPVMTTDNWVTALAVSPDGRTLASGGYDRTVRLWSADGTPIETLGPLPGVINALDVSPDGRRLAAGCSDGSLLIWDLP